MSDLSMLWRSMTDAWPPPPDITVSEWADRHAIIPAGVSGQAGSTRWRTRPFQRAILDAFSHHRVERITCRKSARIGWTSILQNAIGYWVHHDPRSVLVVQPTEDDAKEWSKEALDPIIEETGCLAPLFSSPDLRSESTLLQKFFAGGSIRIRGAQTARGFRRFTVGAVVFDEVDGYPLAAGDEGDQIKLGERRAETVFNRKIGIGSTPTLAGFSRIERLLGRSSRGYYVLSCPHCGGEHVRLFRQPEKPLVVAGKELAVSHLTWQDGKPETAGWVCPACGAVIGHSHHVAMVEGGYWWGEDWTWTQEGGFEFEDGFDGNIGFVIWSAYNYSPASTPQAIAREWFDSKDDAEQRQVFINTVLGESFEDEGEQPAAHGLMQRLEAWGEFDVPVDVDYLTCMVDVQGDRLELEVSGWLRDTRESWSVEYLVLPGDPDEDDVWLDLADAVETEFSTPDGPRQIDVVAIDVGYRQDRVMKYIRDHGAGRTLPFKGVPGKREIVESLADRLQRLRRLAVRGDKVRPVLVGVDEGKLSVYRALQVQKPGPRYCHFPAGREEAYFEGLTAEKLIPRYRKGWAVREWHKVRERNEPLDCRVGNLALCLLMEQGVVPRRVVGSALSVPEVSAVQARRPVGLGREGWVLR